MKTKSLTLTQPHNARPFRRTSFALAAFTATALFMGSGMAASSSCCKKMMDPSSCEVVAQGKGVQITRAELENAETEFLAHQGIKRDAISKERLAGLQRKLLEGLVSEALLLQVADNIKISGVDDRVQAEIAKVQSRFKDEAAFQAQLKKAGMTLAQVKENLGRQIRIQEAIAAHVPKAADPSKEEVEKFYNEHKEAFAKSTGTPTLDAVRSEIAEFLKEDRAVEGIQAYLKKLEQDAGVTYSLATVETEGGSPRGKT